MDVWTQSNLSGSYDFSLAKLTLALNDESFVGLKERRASVGVQIPVGIHSARPSYGLTRTDANAQSAGLYGAQAFGGFYLYAVKSYGGLRVCCLSEELRERDVWCGRRQFLHQQYASRRLDNRCRDREQDGVLRADLLSTLSIMPIKTRPLP